MTVEEFKSLKPGDMVRWTAQGWYMCARGDVAVVVGDGGVDHTYPEFKATVLRTRQDVVVTSSNYHNWEKLDDAG